MAAGQIVLWAGVFIASLFFVVKSADRFIDFARRLGVRFGIPPFILGLTVVAMGTSLPELATSLAAVFRGLTAIPVDNVVGSNIANILLVIGISAVAARVLVIRRDLINIDLPLLVASTAVLVFTLWDGVVARWEGVLALVVFATYIHYTVKGHLLSETHEVVKRPKVGERVFPLLLGTALSLAVLVVASEFTIRGMTRLAGLLGIAESFLAITALAIGTSLPELTVSVIAALKKQYELSVGNILGSNVFNSSLIIGTAALAKPLAASPLTLTVGIPALIAAVILMAFSGISRKVHIWEGILFLAVYALFIAQLIAAL